MQNHTNRNGHTTRITLVLAEDRRIGAGQLAERIVNDLDVLRPEIRSANYAYDLANKVFAVLAGVEDHYEIPGADTVGGIPVTIELEEG